MPKKSILLVRKGGDGIGKVEPKYILISRELRQQIEDGSYPINSRLPDGKTLAEIYKVSLMTMKRALDLLVAEGVVIRRRGDGSFVRDWKSGKQSRLYSLQGAYQNYQEQLTSKVLTFDIIRPSEAVADKLSISTDDFVYHIVRLRLLENRPIIIEYTYMPVAEVPHLKREHVERSIYSYVTTELNRRVHSAFVKIAGKRPTVLECREMGLSPTDFLMEIEQVGCLDNCRVFEYSISHHLPEVFDFETVMFNQ
ncbi:DNA-binding GntR family transcriptional regulator [Streptococcus rupicaprae]|uniref:DNA-binding GntR family transcriptional regulator n=1 Tax=Streptococcus rupicaprae TaxID=759619 RepID=A0ABV2FK95_9STRE